MTYKHHPRCGKSIDPARPCDMSRECRQMNPHENTPKPDLPPTLWKVAHKDKSILVLAHHPVSWHNVKTWSYRVFKADDVMLTNVTSGAPDYELRWIGSAAGAVNSKRMQAKTVDTDWSDT